MSDALTALGWRVASELLQTSTVDFVLHSVRHDASLPLRARFLGAAAAYEIHALHQLEISSLPNPQFLRADPLQFFLDHLSERGRIVGISLNDRIIAYGILGLPQPDHPNLGSDLSLPAADLPSVAHLDGVTVEPVWRGSGLQRVLAWARLRLAAAYGRGQAIATVAPENYYSWRNLMQVGFLIKSIKQKYNLGWRFILHARTVGIENRIHPELRYLPIRDVAEQRQLLDSGFWGYDWRETARGIEIGFGPGNPPERRTTLDHDWTGSNVLQTQSPPP